MRNLARSFYVFLAAIAAAQTPDAVYLNGKIVTVDPRFLDRRSDGGPETSRDQAESDFCWDAIISPFLSLLCERLPLTGQ